MSSRGDFVGSAPNSGNYIPSPVPAENEDLPVYVNDELLRLGGAVNGILEGGALPPHSALPKRFREGMIMNFSQPINDEIYSSGVWLYKKGQWWKLIDDPTEIGVPRFIYKLTEDDTQPITPQPSGDTPEGWSNSPPFKSNKSNWIWVSSSINYDFKSKVYTWADPVPWSAGVEDGNQGESFETWFADSPFRPETPTDYPPVGSDSIPWSDTPPTNEGAIIWAVTALVDISNPTGTVWTFPVRWNGSEGSKGQRGFLGITIPGTAWSDEAAWDAIVAETVGLTPNQPIPWDNVTIYDDPTGFVETKRFASGTTRPGVWEPVAKVIDGDLIVRGTIATDALRANAVTTDKLAAGAVSADKVAANAITGVKIDSATTIRAGTGDQSASLDGASPTWRIYAGSATPANAPFRVDKDGNLFATTGSFGGTVYAEKVDGDFTDTVSKVIPYTAIPAVGNSGAVYTDIYSLKVSSLKPYVRTVRIDQIAFECNDNSNKLYGIYVYKQGLDPAGNPSGPEQIVEQSYIYPSPSDWVTLSRPVYFQVPAYTACQFRIVFYQNANTDGGQLLEQTVSATLFKQGNELSFV